MKDKNSKLNRNELVAPCGLNCRFCYRYLRKKNSCPGCRGDDSLKLKSCLNCQIKNCERVKNEQIEFCSECDKFPCNLVKNLDKRYRNSYRISVIENLNYLMKYGVERFVGEEERRWVCSKCHELLCMHELLCRHCEEPRFKEKKV